MAWKHHSFGRIPFGRDNGGPGETLQSVRVAAAGQDPDTYDEIDASKDSIVYEPPETFMGKDRWKATP